MLFGSGESSPTGRQIHEIAFKHANFRSLVKMGILETPTGFEVNAIHGWPERMEEFFKEKLKNYKPIISRIHAWRKNGMHSTNDPKIVDAILSQDYLYCGAGSPEYTISHLAGSRAYTNMITAHEQGTVLCLGSASAIAVSHFALPVYDIFKVGADVHWLQGMNFFARYGLDLAIIPHWNNQEGEDFDTTCCWMGKKRFSELQRMLPTSTTIIGIDEQTACIVDPNTRLIDVVGVGQVIVWNRKKKRVIPSGSGITFEEITL